MKKIYLLLIALVVAAGTSVSAQTGTPLPVAADFDQNQLPSGWTNKDNSNGLLWYFQDSAAILEQHTGNQTPSASVLFTQALDASLVPAPVVRFDLTMWKDTTCSPEFWLVTTDNLNGWSGDWRAEIPTTCSFGTPQNPMVNGVTQSFEVLILGEEFVYIGFSGNFGDGYGKIMLDNVRVERKVPVGIEEGIAAGFNVYPSPFTTQLKLDIPDPYGSYELIDLSGKTIKAGEFRAGSSLDTQDVPAGMYLIRIWDENGGLLGTRKVLSAN